MLNLKGGVGKTHLCWLLAGVAQEQKRRVLLVDTDAQGNLSLTFQLPPDGKPGIEALFDPGREPDAGPLIRRTGFSHIDLIPANPKLFRYDISDQEQWQKSELHRTLVEALTPLKSQYEFIVIDCPPRLSLASMTALCAADGVVVPLEAADWGAQGVNEVSELIRYVQKHHNAKLKLLGLLCLAKQASNFESPRVHFTPHALISVLRWAPTGKNYQRLRDSLRRLKALTIRYENAWWDKEGREYQSEFSTGIIAEYFLATQIRGRRKAHAVPENFVVFSPRFYESLQKGNLKRLDLNTLFSLKLPTSQRMYRFLDKRFYGSHSFEMDLVEFACGHIGMTPTKNVAHLKQRARSHEHANRNSHNL